MKLHVYLDDWLIRADTPERLNCKPRQPSGCSSSWLDHQLREVRSHTKSRLPVHWDAVQHSTFHSGALPKMRLKVQSVHQYWMTNPNITARDLHRLLGMLVFVGFAGPARTALSSSSPIVGRHSMVPEDRETGPTGFKFHSGSVRDGMVVIPSSPARSTPRHQGTEVTLFTDASSSSWGAS